MKMEQNLLRVGILSAALFLLTLASGNSIIQAGKDTHISDIQKLISEKKFDEAQKFIDVMLDKLPLDKARIINIVEKLIKADRLAQSEEILTRAILKQPGFEEFYIKRGLVYLFQNTSRLAINDFSKALKLNPGNVQIRIMLADCYQSTREFDKALQEYSELIRLESGKSKWYCKRGYLYSKKKRFDLALEDFDQALRLDEENEQAIEGLRRAHYKLFNEKLENP
ncbi:tetratricopeptide repeat protein [bacterium]|nr:tetratricopeptide repeat protein [bacterium]